ncbi:MULTISPECIES: FAD-dependent oxidoreductase [Clostridium]|uniref:Gamma-glutamylputrescine oxidoreductase n=2 Tax=Clostridium TaxID=1485 RepID=D8GRN4_CLOLD|nr:MULTISPECIES: FAD-dependent oxidoreductase [Clostridium]ADK16402.1 predicted oxidoreductase [Clostridium ljungdahlii DSM 13528]AGY75480.1 FAD-dependent oxidoreductase [Clostridium autoethanogenum DSM 10061]ALU35646.1 FAD-dependent oxidoreductase [Clostridium autoethanogenum DSM 10061]OAA89722.1 Gamma-glutamylputrescine oxidoreductase [Clostridium ljungdahlii DSM 13528]OVY52292.1 Gamma-glutamylputrescine oxidoreductase [Clostridium autoethanogenum]
MNKCCTNPNAIEGILESYWIDSTSKTNYPSLKEDIQVDIAIIGGGIAGITCAFLLKKEGFKVAVLEADNIANGTSGHTTAKITSQHHLIYDKLINEFGMEKARQYAEANEISIRFIENLVKEYNIDCDYKHVPAYMYTQDKNYVKSLEKEVKAAQSLGLKAEYLDNIPLPLPIEGAVYFKDQAEFHPKKYLLSLADKIPGNGSYIFEKTTIIDVESEAPCILLSRNGKKVTSSKLIIASHFPCYDNLGLYFTRLKPDRSYVLALKIKEKFPEGTFINAESPGRSLRSQTDNGKEIVLIGGEGHKTAHGENTINHYNNLKCFSENIFSVEKILYQWSTQDYITLDGVPYIGKLTSSSKNIYVATGFGKWGMTNSTAAAVLLKDLIMNHDNPWEQIYNPSRSITLNSTKNFFVENFDVAKQLLEGKLSYASSELKFKKGEGKVFTFNGNKYGAYKDEDGITHIVDITCTHIGCELVWNDAEKTWDCPCHGSRFSYEGDVVEGPAHRRLNHFREKPNKPDPNIV